MRSIGPLALALALAGCPPSPGAPDGGAGANPPQLWLALNGSELMVKLQPVMPNPF